MHPPSRCPDDDADADIALPCAQALLAATLALMSAYAAAVAGSEARARGPTRRAMARKIVSNLACLQTHLGLDEPMRRVATKLHRHWCAIAGTDAAAPALH